ISPAREFSMCMLFFFSSRRRHTRSKRDWSSDVCSSDLTYSLSGTFTQLEKGKYPEAYGLFTGGKNLQEENQQYLYFLVRQDGKYLIKRRTGAETETIVDWTESEAVQPMDDDTGPTENRLEIKKEESGIAFLINGQEVERMGLSELSYLEGRDGLRVNHNLNGEVEQCEVSGGMEENKVVIS